MLKKWMSLVSIMCMFLLSGCQGAYLGSDDNANNLRKKNSDQMNLRGNNNVDSTADRGKNKQHMVEDDITNQNPNFLDLKRTGSGGEAGATNHGNDINKAKQVIADTNEFRTDSIWINGDRMWVTVYKKGMLSDKARNDAEARLHRKLVKALPRYNIEVRVQEDRT
ncbi:hypothetical protein FB550_107126 [Neobacillus bataviensis]|uniref:Sporulation lipoprotein YhcN/YlaJ n=1 Tax=Neobacillus bataviensis TaxID=220685 RepID=A0A561D7U2_9BACI|nr:hypothetical protein [Neobacillus bataviensis]TWD99491.1 hypothetical protein FB550_107126 [Neobacillus bataviensis]